MIIKGGEIAWANMGDPNASIPTPQPVTSHFLISRFMCSNFGPFLLLIDQYLKDGP